MFSMIEDVFINIHVKPMHVHLEKGSLTCLDKKKSSPSKTLKKRYMFLKTVKKHVYFTGMFQKFARKHKVNILYRQLE